MQINNDRLTKINEYHFKQIDDIKVKLISEGKNIIDLGIGDPDIKTNLKIVNALIEGLEGTDFNKYPPYEGIKELKLKIAKYYYEVYSVSLDLDEILILIGSKEGLSNIIPATCNFGDYVIVPNPAYPVYEKCSYLWGVKPYNVSLKEENRYLLDIKDIPNDISEKSKLMIINYPNNPTGAVANEKFYLELIQYCKGKNIVLCNDGAYNEIIGVDEKNISVLQYDKNICVEFGTLSKTYNMTGFRIGYAVGNKKILNNLLKVKSNIDSGQFKPIQYAAMEALSFPREYIINIRKIYDERRNLAKEILKKKNIQFYDSMGTFYVWCKVPNNYTTEGFCKEILFKYGIIVTPGNAFGIYGEGYFRIALTVNKNNLMRALNSFKVYN
ncbi:aminotransferase class I/II-fold pyridoxal phosphate-dependent enzyme [Clostridium sp. MB40-C1]|uniref:aminotransferase class I/II-fold pyridoxal phosphate-dependent enzyme n=1 Tax=Clostridium sp. MB40-C1 TaxID=3070996 RepID=UPI0027DF7EC3|nr:aminotransferase class I/II-fold pyridoxal phosphate-dependent enzyme [Clostridium sp. MB40-C1]WMJ82105.1 aminotransferase class I/II-fold pyridoxal phosphate-dependent enzyme [Clostridium sp. MB40-C1]